MKIRLREEKSEKGNNKRYFGCNRMCAVDRGDGGAGVLAAVQCVRRKYLMVYAQKCSLMIRSGKTVFLLHEMPQKLFQIAKTMGN